MDASKFCYSAMITQASTNKSNEAFIKLLTDKEPLKSVQSQMQALQLNPNVVHPVAYISDSFPESQGRWPAITKKCFGVLCQSKSVPFIYNIQIYCMFRQ